MGFLPAMWIWKKEEHLLPVDRDRLPRATPRTALQ
jgi:hypothetical protein